MVDRNNGGSAFPKYFGGNVEFAPGESAGMTLRDYFAGQALAGWLAYGAMRHIHASGVEKGKDATKILATACYEAADVMIAERDR